VWRGFAFDPRARVVPEHLMLWSGEWALGSRAWDGLERGGDSPEGASSPRARRRFARGGVQPSSEEEISWYDACPSSEHRCWPLDGPLRLFGS
jgi:hypothetical protein